MSKSILIIDTPETCGDCPCHIRTADEKRAIGYCHTSDEDYYCKLLDRFMEYDEVDGGIDILGKPADCPLKEQRTGQNVLDKIRAEILEEKDCAYADFEQYKVDYLRIDAEYVEDELPQDDFRYGMERCIDIIDKYKAESEV